MKMIFMSCFHLEADMTRQTQPLFRAALTEYNPGRYVPPIRFPRCPRFNEYGVIIETQFFNLTSFGF